MGYVQGMCDLLAPLLVILDDGMYVCLSVISVCLSIHPSLCPYVRLSVFVQGMCDLLAPLLVIVDDGMSVCLLQSLFV